MRPRRRRPVRGVAESLESRLLLNSYLVTTLADDGGAGTLRSAIRQANTNPGADTINFASGLQGTITLMQGQLELADTTGATTITGPGAATISISGGKSRVFQIDANVTAEIDGLTVTGGHAPDGAAGAMGVFPGHVAGGDAGTGANGGGMLNAGTLTMTGVNISGNSAGTGGTGGAAYLEVLDVNGGHGGDGGGGGGIYNSGSLVLVNSTVRSNHAGAGGIGGDGSRAGNGGGGGAGGGGGGIFNSGSLSVQNSTFDANGSGPGRFGGIGNVYQMQGDFAAVGGAGGAIYNVGTLSILDATVSNNKSGAGGDTGGRGVDGGAGGSGGGIYNGDAATARLVNVTLAQDAAGAGGMGGPGAPGVPELRPGKGGPGGNGGGIYASGIVTLTNTTTASNTSGKGGPGGTPAYSLPGTPGSDGTGGGIFVAATSHDDTTLYNTIVAGNAAPSAVPDDIHGSLDAALASGQSASQHDLIGTGSGGLTNGINGNIVGVGDPKLAPLGDYGGPTQTMPPLPGSSAIDGGSNALSVGPDGKPLLTDQRGLPRISGGVVDIGSVEFQLIPGDANQDGVVNFADFLILAQNYGRGSCATWEDGDFNGDGAVGFDDLLLLAQNWRTNAAAVPVGVTELGNPVPASNTSRPLAPPDLLK